MKTRIALVGIGLIGLLCSISLLHSPSSAQMKGIDPKKKAQIERGRYIVSTSGCNDCHSPKIFTPKGPIPDTTRLLSGHPAQSKLPQVPQGVIGPDQWGALTSNDFTAWAGPWGTSFTRNLTPDVATGLGSWTEDIFIKAIRTGKDMGEGRDILPPMPWPEYRNLNDQDLKAVFAYLRSLKPIENAVPDPIAPSGEKIPTLKGKGK
jgi:hypothetical protein